MPGDVTSSLIIAAAAALIERVDVTAVTPPTTTNLIPFPVPSTTATAAPATAATATAAPFSADVPAARMLSVAAEPAGPPEVLTEAVVQQLGADSPATALPPLAIYHSTTSSMSVLSHMEAYAMAYDFFTKHRPKFALGKYVPFLGTYKFNPWRQRVARAWVAAKVNVWVMPGLMLACGLLRGSPFKLGCFTCLCRCLVDHLLRCAQVRVQEPFVHDAPSLLVLVLYCTTQSTHCCWHAATLMPCR